MNNHQILRTIQECSHLLGLDPDSSTLTGTDSLDREYENEELVEFIRDLVESGSDSGMIMLEKHLREGKFREFMKIHESPIVVFAKDDELAPVIIHKKYKKYHIQKVREHEVEQFKVDNLDDLDLACTDKLEVIFLSVFDYESLVSDQDSTKTNATYITPLKRLFKLLSAEKRDILYVYVYAALIGLLSLSLPLGIQAAVELISGGVVFSSVYVLIAFVIIAVLGTGILQVFQITIVEYLQRRVFTKAAFEFAFRVPRIQMESVFNLHMPELMNRFFDVLTLQKGLPKLLIDLSTGAIQIIFGLLLLSFYHPFFVFFGIFLLSILFMIFYITGPKGLKSSITESKYKYKVVYWLEEMARTLYSFKLSGNTALPIKKTDYNVNNYLKNRSTHFKVLISQYSYVLLFKAIVTGGLLIIGTVLVVQREITLGQFVASEVIIILILNSVEKIIMYMDVVYDMLTAVDKISHVTDLPLEKTGGIDIPKSQIKEDGISIEIKNLSYTYPGNKKPSLDHINLSFKAGERVCIAGGSGSGKTTLTNAIAGIHTNYDGILTYNRYNLRDLDMTYLRDKIGKNVSPEDIFEGSVIDNILVGKPFASMDNAIRAVEKVGLTDEIYGLSDGFNTEILSGGKGFSSSFANKMILARCLAKDPALLILNDFFGNFQKFERLQMIEMLTNPENKWTLILVSNDPLVMSAVDRVIYMDEGKIIADDTFENIIKNEEIVQKIY
ncbi:MAG: xenobiotic-transporting ATPase [Flammeovirgaceae bacterium]|nr:xenobiotic-transporting ATPase [Flammeovirgaceae bacterium]MBE62274.1 xenobiotic-transporting ATPase [Flammeovirgaceae bacterium]|tara:strand:- start:5927 stop:8104 length:2178 start_codon:yes stop_codon:yes gene_type:complete